MNGRRVLLINPWIHDFAAYDLWAKPLGLLGLGALLRQNGCEVAFVDCLEQAEHLRVRSGGHGKYHRQMIEKPRALRDVPRTYARYGISVEDFRHTLTRTREPEVVLITALMTYWYPGAFEAIRLVKEAWPATPVILGGVYASLCRTHALEQAGADYVIGGEGELRLLELLSSLWGWTPPKVPDLSDLDSLPYPCFDLVPRPRYVCIQTSRGCPLHCPFCAVHALSTGLRRRSAAGVAREIAYWHQRLGVIDFAFYDDALLYAPEVFAVELLHEILALDLPLRFHCPNGLHVRGITPQVAHLMRACGFVTIRLGLETSDEDRQRTDGSKVNNADFMAAIKNLAGAGFDPADIGVYLLCGLPGQAAAEVRRSVDFVRGLGAHPLITEYSPIPHSPMWDEAVRGCPYPIEKEPLFQNNSLLSCRGEDLSYAMYREIRRQAGRLPRQGRASPAAGDRGQDGKGV